MASASFKRLTFMSLAGLALTGCSLFGGLDDQFADDGSVLNVFVTHHPSPVDGVFPPRNGPPQFVTDTGWDVLLDEAFITTIGATFNECADSGGAKRDLQMYFGALPEDLDAQDLDTLPVGGVQLDSGNWCGAVVHYGPFMPGSSEDYQMPNPDAIGTTIYFRGLATKGTDSVQFEVRVNEPMSILVSMTQVYQGNPLKITDSNNPAVTISKNYDHFFDGVDFNNYTDEELRDLSLAALADQTRISFGTTVMPTAP